MGRINQGCICCPNLKKGEVRERKGKGRQEKKRGETCPPSGGEVPNDFSMGKAGRSGRNNSPEE